MSDASMTSRPGDRATPTGDTSPQGSDTAPVGSTNHEALYATDLVALAGGRLIRDSFRPIRGASVDSRLVRPGNLFIALPGLRTDGHRFMREAVVSGAAGLLVSVEPDAASLAALGDVTVVVVPDPQAALHALAAGWRARFSPLVVGVTGSIAKTSTKEAIACVLAARGRTLRTEGNQNNEIGVPITLLRLSPDDRYVVLEMGMYAGGEIAQLARLARPDIGVVTTILGVHLSRIGTIEAVENAKAELIEALAPEGVAVLNADDPRVRGLAARTAARVITYGFTSGTDVGADRVRSAGGAGMRFRLIYSGPAGIERRAVSIPSLGRLSVHNALAAAAVGIAVGMTLDEICRALAGGWSAPRRGELSTVAGITIVDDSYNASPASMVAALGLLAGLPGRRVAVLGEMLELGEDAEASHRQIGAAAAAICAVLVAVGSGASGIAVGARQAGMDPKAVIEVADRSSAIAVLLARLQRGDVVLVKASRSAELDLLVDLLKSSLS